MTELLDDFNDNEDLIKERHGCVSGCLWFMIAMSVLSVLMYFAGKEILNAAFESVGEEPIHGTLLLITTMLTGISVFGYYMILQWKRTGFYLVCALSVASGVARYIFMDDIISLLGVFIWPLIIFATLQIRKNGVSAWDHLE